MYMLLIIYLENMDPVIGRKVFVKTTCSRAKLVYMNAEPYNVLLTANMQKNGELKKMQRLI